MSYDDWSRDELLNELRTRDAAAAAPKQVARSLNLLETLHHAQTDFITVDSETNIFNRMLDNYLEVTGCEYGFIDELFYEADGAPYLEARAITNIAWDDGSRALYAKLVSGEIKFDNLRSVYGEVMKTGEPYFSHDVPTDPKRTGIPPGHPPLNTFLGIPLYAGGEFVGVLGLANAPGGFRPEILDYLAPLNKICGIIMLSLKIDRRRAEAIARLQHMTEELKASNDELQTFAYVASHDLQTPLRAISGFVTLLQKDYAGQLDERADGWIQHVVDATRRLQSLITDLLQYSRVGAAEPAREPTDLGELLALVMESLKPDIEDAGASVTAGDLPVVAGDRSLLEQLLQNLLGNALKYRSDAPPAIHVAAERTDGVWTLSVRDNGLGIDPKHHDKVFEVFRRLHTQQQIPGSGVGLAVCRRVVHRHGGELWLESAPGAGTTFFFTLPEATA